MVAATLEVERGIENLWKQGEGHGFKPNPDFGQFDAFDTLNFSFTSDDGNTNPDEETNAAVNDTNEALLDSQSRSSIAANNVAPEHGQQRRQVTKDSIQTRSQSGAKQGGGHTRRKKRG